MYTTLALVAFLSGSALAQSTSSSPSTSSSSSASTTSSSSSSSSSGGPLTTSMVLLPDRAGQVDASIINVGPGGTTMALACPKITSESTTTQTQHKRRQASSSSSSTNQCAYVDLHTRALTLTEGAIGTSTTTIDFVDPFTFNVASSSTTGGLQFKCTVSGTTAASCSTSWDVPSAATKNAHTTDTRLTPGVTKISQSAIKTVQVVVTAGQEKLSSASLAATRTSSSSTSSGTPMPTNAAGENRAAMGMTGAVMAGVMGFAMMA